MEETKYMPVVRADDEEETASNFNNVKNDKMEIQLTTFESTNMSSNSSSKKFLYIAACAANIIAFTSGTAFGWTSPEIPKLNGEVDPQFNPLDHNLTKQEESWIGSILPVGAALGPFAAGIAADKIGRKKTLLITGLPFIIAYIMAAYATKVFLFYVSRFLIGLSIGAVFTVLPMYIGEIAEDSVRGALGSFMQLFITFGLLFSYAIGPYTTITHFNIACVLPAVIFIIIFHVYIPESPYYLIAADKKHDAEAALKKLRSKSSAGVSKELEEIQRSVEESLGNKAGFSDIFKSNGLEKALMLSVGLVAFQQFSGINVILFYTQTIFAATGSTISAEISTIIIGVVQILGSFITPALVDKSGKRLLLLISAIGMGISQAVLGYYFYLKDSGTDVSGIFWLPILCLISYMITYCAGFGPLPWAVMAELFPGNIKSSASTVTACACWLLAFIITKFFGTLADMIGNAGSFWVFAVGCALATIFVYKFLPETTGKSLQEIQDILNGSNK